MSNEGRFAPSSLHDVVADVPAIRQLYRLAVFNSCGVALILHTASFFPVYYF